MSPTAFIELHKCIVSYLYNLAITRYNLCGQAVCEMLCTIVFMYTISLHA